ncbi:TPA: hypothetical protein ACRZSU_001244 [Campylobacter jejuni]
MQIIEPKNKNFLTPKQLECEFGISLSKQYKMRMQKIKIKLTPCLLLN